MGLLLVGTLRGRGVYWPKSIEGGSRGSEVVVLVGSGVVVLVGSGVVVLVGSGVVKSKVGSRVGGWWSKSIKDGGHGGSRGSKVVNVVGGSGIVEGWVRDGGRDWDRSCWSERIKDGGNGGSRGSEVVVVVVCGGIRVRVGVRVWVWVRWCRSWAKVGWWGKTECGV